ncbi:hypothetical protein DHD08_02305 [Arenibacter sp. H213]|nr:hypothetical protein [Arenibacter sp. H213]
MKETINLKNQGSMFTKNKVRKKGIRLLFVLTLFALPLIFTSCNEDEAEFSGEPFFMIEENPTGLSVGVAGETKTYIVRSNRPWKIVSQGEVEWVKAFPAEGKDDGVFKIVVSENDGFDPRTINFAFVVDGNEQPLLFRVDQEANVPYITLEVSDNGVATPSAQGEVNIAVKANVIWTYALEDASWLSEIEMTEQGIKLLADRNYGEERSTTVTISSALHPTLAKETVITQSAGNIILEEDFNWLTYGSPIFYAWNDPNEIRMDQWTDEEKAKGWTSTESELSSGQQIVYARPGFVKLGKTGVGGDLISPALAALEGPTKVLVTFKAVPYKTKGGSQDDNILHVSVIGDGATNVSTFTIDNWPEYDENFDAAKTWQEESAHYEFIITGATAATKLKFLGGDYNLVGIGAGKNRIFIDDIKVEIID